MKKIVLLYWPKGGNTENAAAKIAKAFDNIDVFDIKSFNVEDIKNYDFIITGASTIGAENWEDASNDNEWSRLDLELRKHDLSNKYVAFFGLGDQVLYPEHFVDVLGNFEKEFQNLNAKIVGRWPSTGYQFTDSDGEKDGFFYGLAIDEDNEDELTEERANKWATQIMKEMVE